MQKRSHLKILDWRPPSTGTCQKEMTSIKLFEGSDAQGPNSDFTIGGWC